MLYIPINKYVQSIGRNVSNWNSNESNSSKQVSDAILVEIIKVHIYSFKNWESNF